MQVFTHASSIVAADSFENPSSLFEELKEESKQDELVSICSRNNPTIRKPPKKHQHSSFKKRSSLAVIGIEEEVGEEESKDGDKQEQNSVSAGSDIS